MSIVLASRAFAWRRMNLILPPSKQSEMLIFTVMVGWINNLVASDRIDFSDIAVKDDTVELVLS